MNEKWAKIKEACDNLTKMVMEYDAEEMGEPEEETEEQGMEADSEDMGSEGSDAMLPDSGEKGKKVNKVSIASAIIKKKMGL